MQKVLIIATLILCSHNLFAQKPRNLAESQQMMKMDEGVEFMNEGKFAEAEELFKEVLLNVEVVPADLCFYFGKNSYLLDKDSQSIDWLNKYIELKGTSGRFFDQAVEYLKLAEERFNADKVASKNDKTEKPVRKELISCEQTPFVVCPACQGEGVLIEKGSLGSSVYKACHYCKETGRMSCESYKLYVKGQWVPEEEN